MGDFNFFFSTVISIPLLLPQYYSLPISLSLPITHSLKYMYVIPVLDVFLQSKLMISLSA